MREPVLQPKWEDLTLKDGFIFAQVMKNPRLCQTLIEKLLGLSNIEKIEYIEAEKSIDLRPDSKGIRLDVYIKDSDAIFNIEMQRSNTYELAQRSRYYQDLMDLDVLAKGEHYRTLKKSYVVFICTDDIFGQGFYRYSFENRCEEVEGLRLEDGTYKVFFNTKGTKGNVDASVKAFLSYLDGKVVDDPFVKELDEEVRKVKHSDHLKIQYAGAYIEKLESFENGVEQGLEQGLERGLERGRKEERARAEVEKLKIVKNFINSGVSIDVIINSTGLSEAEILKLKSE